MLEHGLLGGPILLRILVVTLVLSFVFLFVYFPIGVRQWRDLLRNHFQFVDNLKSDNNRSSSSLLNNFWIDSSMTGKGAAEQLVCAFHDGMRSNMTTDTTMCVWHATLKQTPFFLILKKLNFLFSYPIHQPVMDNNTVCLCDCEGHRIVLVGWLVYNWLVGPYLEPTVLVPGTYLPSTMFLTDFRFEID